MEFLMKNLKSLSDAELLTEIRSLSSEERRLGVEVLYRLKEIEARKLYALEGYSSLHEFTVKELKYSDGAAHRRIQAMRLLKDLPAIEEKLKSGELTLSNASQLQDFLRAEKKLGKTYESAEKKKLAEDLIGKSTREAQALLTEISPQAMPKESIRPMNLTEAKLTLVIGESLQEKLERLKGLLAHQLPESATYAELLEKLADVALEKLDPQLKKIRNTKEASAPELANSAVVRVKAPTRYIAVSDKKALWVRAQGQCEHLGPKGERCRSRFALQIDHIHPFGKGGSNELGNLQLLCRVHNGAKNMRDYGFMFTNHPAGPGPTRVGC
jgi:5-methylcytosine-specific restriction endonuclease McrA